MNEHTGVRLPRTERRPERHSKALTRPEKPSTREMITNPDAFSWATVLPHLQAEMLAGKTLVITNGHFVLLHPGHALSFEQAREQAAASRIDHDDNGVVLLVIVNNDGQTASKDPSKAALQTAQERALNVFNERHTDYVAISEVPGGNLSLADDFQRLVENNLIGANTIYVKGGDYGTQTNVPPEAQIVIDNGGTFIVVDRVGDYSSSRLATAIQTTQ